MDLEKVIVKNGDYLNIEFKEMDNGDIIKITPVRILKSGTASKNGKTWEWNMFLFALEDGREVSGFAPTTWMGEEFKKALETEFEVERYTDKKAGKMYFRINKDEDKPQATTSELVLNEKEQEAVDTLKAANNTDKDTWVATIKSNAGVDDARANKIFEVFR